MSKTANTRIIGKTFGKLTVLKLHGRSPQKRSGYRYYWLCKCACGNEISVRTDYLTSGLKKSCGCDIKMFGRIPRNGMSKTSIYGTWRSMINRCHNPNNTGYHNYGGRGITVCDRWLNNNTGLLNFISDMGERPPKKSLDRIDNNGNYYPENCRWATRKEQQQNRRKTKMICFDGVTKPAVEWSEEFGLPYDVFARRINSGWSLDLIKSVPIKKNIKSIKNVNKNIDYKYYSLVVLAAGSIQVLKQIEPSQKIDRRLTGFGKTNNDTWLCNERAQSPIVKYAVIGFCDFDVDFVEVLCFDKSMCNNSFVCYINNYNYKIGEIISGERHIANQNKAA